MEGVRGWGEEAVSAATTDDPGHQAGTPCRPAPSQVTPTWALFLRCLACFIAPIFYVFYVSFVKGVKSSFQDILQTYRSLRNARGVPECSSQHHSSQPKVEATQMPTDPWMDIM